MAGLTSLTLDAYQELASKGKVEQVSEPLMVILEYGRPMSEINGNIEFRARRDYPTANGYIAGISRQIQEGLITPFVFYKISE